MTQKNINFLASYPCAQYVPTKLAVAMVCLIFALPNFLDPFDALTTTAAKNLTEMVACRPQSLAYR